MQTFVISVLGTYVFTWIILSCFRGILKKNAIAIWVSLIVGTISCGIVDGIYVSRAELKTEASILKPIKKPVKGKYMKVEDGDTSWVNEYMPELRYDVDDDALVFNTSEGRYKYTHNYRIKVYVVDEGHRMYFVCLDTRPMVSRDNLWVTSWVRPKINRERVLVMPRHWISTMSKHRQKALEKNYDFYKLTDGEREVVSKAVESYEAKHYGKQEKDNLAWCTTKEDR